MFASRLTRRLALTSFVAGAALVFASACGSDDDDNGAAADGGGADAQPVAPADATLAGFTDGQIWQILVTFDQGEITEADTASAQASSASLRELAGGFDESYANVDAQLVQFARRVSLVAAPSDEATSLAAATTADEALYPSLQGAAFDTAFLSAQINAQQALINLIDTQLTASVTSADLAGLLGTERQLLATNLAGALSVQSGADGGTSGPDASVDAGLDATADATADATVDAATDAAVDAADGDATTSDADASDADTAEGDDASDAADGD